MKYSSEEFSGNLLKLVKQKEMYLYEYKDSFKKFSGNKLLNRFKFFSSLKGECISGKEYLVSIDILNMFKMNRIADYQDIDLKTDAFLLAYNN